MPLEQLPAEGLCVDRVRGLLAATVAREEADDLVNKVFGLDPTAADNAMQAIADRVPLMELQRLRDRHLSAVHRLAGQLRVALVRGTLGGGPLTMTGLMAQYWDRDRRTILLALEVLEGEGFLTEVPSLEWAQHPLGEDGERARELLEWADGLDGAPHVRNGAYLLAEEVVTSLFAVGTEWQRQLIRSASQNARFGGPEIVGALCTWIEQHIPAEERWAGILKTLRQECGADRTSDTSKE